ncbi:MAG: hypothetical protein HYY26_06605 [Acidobacteria bacterium]|nr:hypothetical protein [Acidobacteriota bacterium]
MAGINWRRVHLGTMAGGLVWSVWSLLVNSVFIGDLYQQAQQAGHLLAQPRYTVGGFLGLWFLTLFILASILSWLYASVRATWGPGPGTALKLGFVGGFVAAFPLSWTIVNWLPLERIVALWWTLDIWVGAVLATFVAGWLYKEA